MNRFCLFLVSLFALFSLSESVQAGQQANSAEKSSHILLRLNPGARIPSLGGDQIAWTGNWDSFHSNPAAGATLPVPQFGLSQQYFLMDNRLTSASFAAPLRHASAMVANVTYLDPGKFDRIGVDTNNDPVTDLGRFHPYSLLGYLGFGKKAGKLSVGAAAKTWQETYDAKDETGWAVDAGLLASPAPSWDLALSLRNLGPAQQGFDLPRRWTVGGAFRPRRLESLSLYSEYDVASDQDPVIRLGSEFRQTYFQLRAGYALNEKQTADIISALTLGAGIRIRGWQLDYSWRDAEDLGAFHQFSLTFGLGLTPEDRKAAALQIDNAILARMQEKSAEDLRLADEAAKTQDWPAAIAGYTSALTWNPESAAAQEGLAQARLNHQAAEAKRLFDQGKAFQETGRLIDAAFYFQQANTLLPNDKKISAALGDARAQLAAAQRSTASNQVDEAFQKGSRHYIDGRFDEALEAWQFVLDRNPAYPGIQEYVAKARANELEIKLAKREDDPLSSQQSLEALNQKAHIDYSVGNREQAIQAWELVLAKDPANKDARRSLDEARRRENLGEGAGPHNADEEIRRLNSEGVQAYIDGKYEVALGLWKRALALSPNDVRLQNKIDRLEKEMVMRGIRQVKKAARRAGLFLFFALPLLKGSVFAAEYWSRVNPLSVPWSNALAIGNFEDTLFVSGEQNVSLPSLWKSTDTKTWTPQEPLPGFAIIRFALHNGELYGFGVGRSTSAVTGDRRVVRYNGVSWIRSDEGEFDAQGSFSDAVSYGGYLYVSDFQGRIWRSQGGPVTSSAWQLLTFPIKPEPAGQLQISFGTYEGKLYAAAANREFSFPLTRVYVTTDGVTWVLEQGILQSEQIRPGSTVLGTVLYWGGNSLWKKEAGFWKSLVVGGLPVPFVFQNQIHAYFPSSQVRYRDDTGVWREAFDEGTTCATSQPRYSLPAELGNRLFILPCDLLFYRPGLYRMEPQTIPGVSIPAGQQKAPLLSFSIKANRNEQLDQFTVVNLGTAEAGRDLTSAGLYLLGSDGSLKFMASLDPGPNGKTWTLSGAPMPVVDGGVYVVGGDINGSATDGATVQLLVATDAAHFQVNPEYRLAAPILSATQVIRTGPAQDTPSAEGVTIFPSPAQDEVRFLYALVNGGDVVIDVYDLSGLHVGRVEESAKPANPRAVTVWDSHGVPSGSYQALVRVRDAVAGETVLKKKLFIQR